mgnify:CR=1 FL=1
MMPLYLKVLFGFFLMAGLFDVVWQWPPSSVAGFFRMMNSVLWLGAAWVWCAASFAWKNLYQRSLRRGGDTPDDRM